MAEALDASHSSPTADLVNVHADLFKFATRHPFVLSIRDGTVNLASFKTWLGQDYLFVKAFVRFAASVLLKTPRDGQEDLDTLVGVVAALATELDWFRDQADKWGVSLQHLPLRRATQEYTELLEELSNPDLQYAVALAALWSIEVVYSESFQVCLEPDANVPDELLSVCQRWGSQEFKSYVRSIQLLADKALADAKQQAKRKARDYFVQILTQEVSFWTMAQDDTE